MRKAALGVWFGPGENRGGREGVYMGGGGGGGYSSIYTGCVSCLKPPLSTARWPHGQLAL